VNKSKKSYLPSTPVIQEHVQAQAVVGTMAQRGRRFESRRADAPNVESAVSGVDREAPEETNIHRQFRQGGPTESLQPGVNVI
jgi:hypothetical protein